MDYKKLTLSGLFCALVALSTMIIKIPVPSTGGYFNLGDGMIFLSALFLPNPFCALAAGVGSALADLILGAGIYFFPTLVIKGIMGFIAAMGVKAFNDGKKLLIALSLAEIVMVLGYFLFEVFAFGMNAAVVAIPMNLLQGLFGVFVGFFFIKTVKKTGPKT